jgi:hypothetical protein
MCRFDFGEFGKECHLVTHWDPIRKMFHMKRPYTPWPGRKSPYCNSYNCHILSELRCNMDIKSLTPSGIWYAAVQVHRHRRGRACSHALRFHLNISIRHVVVTNYITKGEMKTTLALKLIGEVLKGLPPPKRSPTHSAATQSSSSAPSASTAADAQAAPSVGSPPSPPPAAGSLPAAEPAAEPAADPYKEELQDWARRFLIRCTNKY